MATQRWIGASQRRAQVTTVGITGNDASTTYFLYIASSSTGKFVSVTGQGSAALTATALAEAWEDSEEPEFQEVTATADSSTITLTGADTGQPFTVVSAVSGGAGTIGAASTTVTPLSPHHWSIAKNWSGNAVPVTGVNEQQTITIDAAGGTFTITFSGQTTAALDWNASAATVQTALQGLSTIGAGNITVALDTLVYTLTFANALGYQNVAEVTTDATSLSGGGNTATVATSVAGSAGDDVIIDLPVPIYWGLDQSAVALNSLTIHGTFEGSDGLIGLPQINSEGSADYYEHRDTYLKIGYLACDVGVGTGAGPDRVKINTGTVYGVTVVHKTGNSPENNTEAMLFKGTNAYNVLTVKGDSSVGVAIYGGETATLLTLRMEGGAQVRCGAGVTLGTIAMNSGSLEVNSAIGTSLTMLEGSTVINGTGAVAQLTVRGGTVNYLTLGSLGGSTLLAGNAVLDFSGDPRTKTVSSPIEVHGESAQIIDPNKVVASLIVDANERESLAGLSLGTNARITRGAVA